MARAAENVAYKTVKVPNITVSPEQLLTLLKISDLCRDLYNAALQERLDRIGYAKAWHRFGDETFEWPSFMSQCKALTVIREENPEYEAVRTNTCRAALDKLDGAFKSFWALRKNADWLAQKPRFRSHHFFFSIGWWDSGITYRNHVLTLAHDLEGFSTLSFQIPVYAQGVIGNQPIKKVEIYRDPAELEKPGNFSLSITYGYEKPELVPIKRVVAVSIGTKQIGIVDSRGRAYLIDVWRPDKHWQPFIERLDARRKRCIRGSNAYERRLQARRTIFSKWSNQHRDWQRKLVAWLITLGDCFVLQKETVRLGLSKSDDANADVHRGTQNTGAIARVLQMLKNKCTETGKHYREVKTANVATKCAHCQAKHEELTVGDTRFTNQLVCRCGFAAHRKINTSLQIMKSGLQKMVEDEIPEWPQARSEAVMKILFKADAIKTPRTKRD